MGDQWVLRRLFDAGGRLRHAGRAVNAPLREVVEALLRDHGW